MSRAFSGADNTEVRVAPGAVSDWTGADGTYAFLWLATVAGPFGLLHGLNAGAAGEWGVNPFSDSHLYVSASGFTSDNPATYPTNAWLLDVITINGGAVRYHRKNKTAGTAWTHTNAGSISASSAIGVGGSMVLGAFASNQVLTGVFAAAAVWKAAKLTDLQAEALEFALSAWLAASPTALWAFNQASTANPVLDLTGNGADQTDVVGTTVSANEPPNWSYALPSGVIGTLDPAMGGMTATMAATVDSNTPPPVIDIALDNFGPIVTGIAQCVCAALTALGRPVCVCLLATIGSPPSDFCDCTCADGTANGYLAAYVVSTTPSATWPQADPGVRMDHGCGPPYLLASMAIDIVRCVPTLDSNGQPPSPARQIAAAMEWNADAGAVRQAVGCCLSAMRTANTIRRFSVDTMTVIPDAGGCAGSTLNFRVGIDHCLCSSSG